MIDKEIRQRIQDKIDWCMKTVNEKTGKSFRTPSWTFKQMGRCAGKAYYTRNFMYFNPDFFKNGNMEEMINVTVPHEVAHILSYSIYGPKRGKGHGTCFKSVMRMLGVNEERCHNMSLEGVKVRKTTKWGYKCNCCKDILQLGTNVHNKIGRGQFRWCLKCGPHRGILTFVGLMR